MLSTIALAFVAGFFVGNGLPYYAAGSTGEGVNPSPFPKTAPANVVVGWVAMLIGIVSWHLAGTTRFPVASWSAAALGVLSVGLIHARLWRTDPWRTGGGGAAS